MLKSYSDLKRLSTIEERFHYLALHGFVGQPTFGTERWMNQRFYTSRQWRHVRDFVIVRDGGCDLGVPGYEVFKNPYIHHMNPMTTQHLVDDDPDILNPEYLITVSHQTHNAIHYGDEKLLPQRYTERVAGDTKLW